MLKKLLYILLGVMIAVPVSASALSVSWDRPAVGRINPLYILDTVFGNRFVGTSTTQSSIFPYATTTALSATTLCLSTDCRTTWPSSTFGTTSITASAPLNWNTTTAALTITQSGLSTDGYLSGANFTIFNNKISSTSLSVTTTGTSGAATYTPSTGVFNIPQYQAAGNYITALTGDVTASGPGSAAATLATVNSNVGSFGSATQSGVFTVNGKGLITSVANTTITPAVGSITGLGTGVATWLATPNSANLASALTDETGTGAAVFAGSPALTGTPTAPTAAVNTNTTQLASTAFVLANGAAVAQEGSASGNVSNTSAYPTFVMAGAKFSYTPVRSGKVLIMSQVAIGGGGVPVYSNVWGTGTAPNTGVLLASTTGTIFGALGSQGLSGGSQQITLVAYVTLSVGTTYWFDIATTNLNGVADSINNLQCIIIEL